MTARDEVLARVRRATAAATATVPTRDYRRAGQEHPDGAAPDLVELLVDRLVDYRATVTRGPEASAGELVSTALARHGAARVVVPEDLPEGLRPADVELIVDTGALTAPELDRVDAVVTTSAVAVAETGTIVLDAGPGQGRRVLTLVPDLHVVVVRAHDVVRGVPEALARLDATRPQTWISGPSATSDIELKRVEGVHGPRRLEVVVLDRGDAP